MNSTLVTGHRGYIGTHLMKLMPDAEGCDLKDGLDYRNITGRDWGVVAHLAAYVSVVESLEKPEDYFGNNWSGLPLFLSRNNIGRFVFISTGGAMYGNKHLANEEDAALGNCMSPYARSKFYAEEEVREMCPDHCILRLANVFGGDYSVRGEAAAHAHFWQDSPIIVYGGDQTRDFVHVDTVCRAIVRAAAGTMVGTFNIGSGIETPIMDIARQASQERGVPIETHAKRDGEVDYISLDCTKARDAGLI